MRPLWHFTGVQSYDLALLSQVRLEDPTEAERAMELDPVFVADDVRSFLMWTRWFRGVLVDDRNPPSLKIVVATEADTEAARSAVHPFSETYGLRTKIAVLTDASAVVGSVRPAHLLPYTCHGFHMDILSRGARAGRRLAYIPTTEEELRGLTSTMGAVFNESLDHQVIVAVATGGIPLLHYLIARWCRHTYGCEWPVTTAQYEACRARFKLLFGFRTGDEGSRDQGVTALTEILQGAGKSDVMIVDSTFRRTGIYTIAAAARESIKVVAPTRIDGDPTPGNSVENVECPLRLLWFEADRIIMEDIADAIGYKKVSGQRMIVPTGSDGILVVHKAEDKGYVFMLGTLADAVHGLLDSPGSWLRRQSQGVKVIDNQLRTVFKTCRAQSHGGIIKQFLGGDINAFELGVAVRNATKNKHGVLYLESDPSATYPLLDKLMEEERLGLAQRGIGRDPAK